MRRRFATLDVFARRRFGGNPLAVVLDGEELEATEMQSIAREFNLGETVFVLPAQNPNHRARLRIFTPAAELRFLGLPLVGTAVLLDKVDGGNDQAVLELEIGPIQCATRTLDDTRGWASFQLPRLAEEVGETASHDAIAAALGLSPREIGFDRLKPSRWSAGTPYTFVPVGGLEAIRRCSTSPIHWNAAFGQDGAAYIFSRETVEAASSFHARMFAPRHGIIEDPATGSAVSAFSGAYACIAEPGDGEHELSIEQGYEMGRPSLIGLSVKFRNGQLMSAAISGEAIIVTEGTIET